MKAPTIYRTLLDEATKDAAAGDPRLGGGIDHLVASHVAPSSRMAISSAVKSALLRAYVRGVEHGYAQAAQAFDDRPDDACYLDGSGL